MSEHEVYREIILEECKHPRNKGAPPLYDCEHCEHNKTCGDQLTIYLKLDESKETIVEVGFEGRGCAISQAAASLFTEHIKGKSVEEVEAMDEAEILRLLGITLNPMRMKCAVLIMKSTAKALAKLKCEACSCRKCVCKAGPERCKGERNVGD